MRVHDASSVGLWPRAAALLGRQALELAMRGVWEVTAPGMDRMTFRAQVLCIGTMLNDPSLGGRVSAAWHRLSRASHHGVYDLAPDASELIAALEIVRTLADSAERLRASTSR